MWVEEQEANMTGIDFCPFGSQFQGFSHSTLGQWIHHRREPMAEMKLMEKKVGDKFQLKACF